MKELSITELEIVAGATVSGDIAMTLGGGSGGRNCWRCLWWAGWGSGRRYRRSRGWHWFRPERRLVWAR